MIKGLVSIITPCYNGEHLIGRLLESILQQDYSLIEMIVVDDGSTDGSKNAILQYKELFANKGYNLNYIYQANSGQASAINNALKYVNGEYLTWPDADDFYAAPNAISAFVEAFGNLNDDFSLVRCESKLVNEYSLDKIKSRKFCVETERILLPILDGRESAGVAGTYMTRMAFFDKMYPSRHIYDGRTPQNYQLILPLAYAGKCFTINEELFSILARSCSHSRHKESYLEHIEDVNGYMDIIEHTIPNIPAITEKEKNKYLKAARIYCLTKKFYFSLSDYKSSESFSYAKSLMAEGATISTTSKIRLQLVRLPIILRLADKIFNALKGFIACEKNND